MAGAFAAATGVVTGLVALTGAADDGATVDGGGAFAGCFKGGAEGFTGGGGGCGACAAA